MLSHLKFGIAQRNRNLDNPSSNIFRSMERESSRNKSRSTEAPRRSTYFDRVEVSRNSPNDRLLSLQGASASAIQSFRDFSPRMNPFAGGALRFRNRQQAFLCTSDASPVSIQRIQPRITSVIVRQSEGRGKPINFLKNKRSFSLRSYSICPRHDISERFIVARSNDSKIIKLTFGDVNRHGISIMVNKGTLTFYVRRSRLEKESGTDMFMSALNRLASENVDVAQIHARWYYDSDSVNMRKYIANLGKGMSQEDAVRETWTGHLAQKVGFGEIVDIIEEHKRISVFFEKP